MKSRYILLSFGLLAVSLFIFISCKKHAAPAQEELLSEPQLPQQTYDYFTKHNVNSDMATLGRVLFYDRNLSGNNTISCGSCHKQQYAFADNVRFNKGFNGLDLKRNSPSIQNIHGFNTHFTNGSFSVTPMEGIPSGDDQLKVMLFWDGRQNNLSDMVLNPVMNHNEMSMPDFNTLVSKLKQLSYYPALFKNSYGDEDITKERIAFALEAFLCCLNTTVTNVPITSPQMTVDMSGNPISTSTLTGIAEIGRQLFHNKYNCAKCHDPQNSGGYDGGTSFSPFFANMFNIGLDQVYADQGLGAITGKPGDQGLFKVPTLKNISVTAPYMHDGRFANLGEVLEHYSHNIKPNANLTPLFKNADGTPMKLSILPEEKEAIIAFLNTLKDDDFLTSDMYSDPFKK